MSLAHVTRWTLSSFLTLLVVACSAGDNATATPPQPVASPAPLATATELIGLLPSPTAEPRATPTQEPAPTVAPPSEANAQDLVRAFLEAPYRVVAVARNPLAPYTLIVASERSPLECGSAEEPQRCTADETCGSLYTAPTCFFFVEPSFDVAADPHTRFVARWPETPTLSALATDSFRFVDERTVEFRAAGGDGGYSVEEVWWLDLVTGALALQSRVENSVELP